MLSRPRTSVSGRHCPFLTSAKGLVRRLLAATVYQTSLLCQALYYIYEEPKTAGTKYVSPKTRDHSLGESMDGQQNSASLSPGRWHCDGSAHLLVFHAERIRCPVSHFCSQSGLEGRVRGVEGK